LVNQQTPLWLKGWKSGSNAVLLELVDGRGEPLNPPFNSVVREVRLDPGSPRPPWLGPRLDGPTLARLLGELPSAEPEDPSQQPPSQEAPSQEAPFQNGVAVSSPLLEPEQSVSTRAQESPEPVRMAPDLGQDPGSSRQAALEAAPPTARPLPSTATLPLTPAELDRADQDANQPREIEAASPQQTPSLSPPDAPLTPPSPSLSVPPVDPGGPGAEPPGSSEADRAALPSQAGEGSVPAATGLIPSAREEVNDDGTLIRPARRSPLQALRERFTR
jgi:hypothetical protein